MFRFFLPFLLFSKRFVKTPLFVLRLQISSCFIQRRVFFLHTTLVKYTDSSQSSVSSVGRGKLQFVVLPFALLPFCPFAPLPFCPHFIALAPAMTLFKFWQLSREDIFLFLFSHFGSCVDIVDSPDVTLVCTDDNKDLYLSETN